MVNGSHNNGGNHINFVGVGQTSNLTKLMCVDFIELKWCDILDTIVGGPESYFLNIRIN